MNTGVSDKKNTSESNGDKSNNPSSNALGSDSKEPRKYRGVFPAGRRFRAVMQLDGVRHNLGMHSTEIEAARAYDRFAREHYKKTNFPYPAKRESAGAANASAQRNLQASAAINSLSNDLREQSGHFTSFQSSQNTQSNLGSYSWHANAAISSTTAAPSKSYGSPNAQIFDEAQYPLHHGGYDNGFNQESYLGEQFHPARSYNGSQMSPEYSPRPNGHEWQQPQYWPEPHLQHPPFLFPQHRQGSHPMQTNTANSPMTYVPHPVVYVPVPLPISEAVTKYVTDFHKFEQQQRSESSSNLPPPVPRREPIFTQPQTPFPSMAASATAPDLSSSANLTGSSSAPAAPLLYGAAAHLNHSPSAAQNVENQAVELASHKRPRDDRQEILVLPSVSGAPSNASEGQEVESGSQASSDNSLDSDASFDDDDDDDDEVDEQQ